MSVPSPSASVNRVRRLRSARAPVASQESVRPAAGRLRLQASRGKVVNAAAVTDDAVLAITGRAAARNPAARPRTASKGVLLLAARLTLPLYDFGGGARKNDAVGGALASCRRGGLDRPIDIHDRHVRLSFCGAQHKLLAPLERSLDEHLPGRPVNGAARSSRPRSSVQHSHGCQTRNPPSGYLDCPCPRPPVPHRPHP